MSYGEENTESLEGDAHTSTAFGVLFGNSFGGVWITHTIPGFPDLNSGPALISDEEFSKGHMLMCLTVTLETMDMIADIVRHSEPNIAKFVLPDSLMATLPVWTLIETAARPKLKSPKITLVSFSTREKTLRGVILARSPRDSRCLYKTFAKMQGIVLDVYSNTLYKQQPICEASYSLRYIDSISLKFPEQRVYYIHNKTDRMSFGVSTAASWQRSGQNSQQYWTCAGNIDRQASHPAKGGLITCVDDYYVWLTFDNLKVKEPTC